MMVSGKSSSWRLKCFAGLSARRCKSEVEKRTWRHTFNCSSLLGPCFPAALSFSPMALTFSYVWVNLADGILDYLAKFSFRLQSRCSESSLERYVAVWIVLFGCELQER